MRALGFQDTNGFGVKSDRAIQQAQEWDVVVLKGNAFPGNEGEQHASTDKTYLALLEYFSAMWAF